MIDEPAIRASRPSRGLARTILTLVAAAILLGSAILEASASTTLVKFEANWQADGTILVVWETSSEANSIAYFLYRAPSENGPWNDYYDFEPAAGDESTGASYSFTDDEVTQGVTYWYYLEELDYDGKSTYHGPTRAVEGAISATSTPTSAIRTATSTRTATAQPGQDLTPTATGRPSDTPSPAATETALPAQTPSPTQPRGTGQATPAGRGSPLVTTPTPPGGVPPAPSAAPIPEVTATIELGQTPPTRTPTVAETPTSQIPQQTPTSSPAAQQPVVAPKATSQPLLDPSAAQIPPTPPAETGRQNAANSRLVLLLGAGTLAAAAILGAIVLLIWRLRPR